MATSALDTLELELTCSICTDILYQPLTLLDCLHSFCGACVKRWFLVNGGAGSGHPDRPPEYTCPACRAAVRGTRPNATVTTLLDMFLRARPDRTRSDDDKAALAQVFKPGDDVFPHRPASNTRPRRSVGSADRHNDPNHAHDDPDQRRQVEHQSSLRSLLSVSESDPQEMEAEIMRQITEEGLLDGIDISNMDEAREDEITEMLAQAYRRRQHDQTSHTRRRRAPAEDRPRPVTTNDEPVAVVVPPQPAPSRPVIPSLVVPSGPAHHRSASEGPPGRQNQLGSPRHLLSPTSRLNTLSIRDLGQAAAAAASAVATSPDTPTTGLTASTLRSSHYRRVSDSAAPPQTSISSPRSRSQTRPVTAYPPDRPVTFASPRPTTASTEQPVVVVRDPVGHPAASSESTLVPRPEHRRGRTSRSHPFPEPSVTCAGCDKRHIEYDVHYRCQVCSTGSTGPAGLCIRCFRSGKRCGTAGHSMIAQRYKRPTGDLVLIGPVSPGPRQGEFRTDENPASRLQTGVFCDSCQSAANSCYWRCQICNGGDWGFCHSCTLQARHCTHPLEPLHAVFRLVEPPIREGENRAETSGEPVRVAVSLLLPSFAEFDSMTVTSAAPSAVSGRTPVGSRSTSVSAASSSVKIGDFVFRRLVFNHPCRGCHKTIAPTRARFHCPECDGGRYHLCVRCYSGAAISGQIRPGEGENGWRMCLNKDKRHRMDVVSFSPSPSPSASNSKRPMGAAIKDDRGNDSGWLKRVVVENVVGGWTHDWKANEVEKQTQDETKDEAVVISAGEDETWWWREADGSIKSVAGSADPSVKSRKQSAVGALMDTSRSSRPALKPDGVRMRAAWAWLPTAPDELMFPSGAEIRQVENINGDWFWGEYCRRAGVFPAGYAHRIE